MEEKWCKEEHLANNTFGDQAREEAGLFGGKAPTAGDLDDGGGGSSCYIDGEDVRVVVVRVREGRIADWKGGVKDWVVVDEEEEEEETMQGGSMESAGDDGGRGRRSQDHEETMVNGVSD